MLKQKINKTIEICNIHKHRLQYAYSKISDFLPIDEEKYFSFDNNLFAFIDQFIFRFSKLQDVMGSKLFKEILMVADEDVENLTFRDVLNKLEKIGVLNERQDWLRLRELRNSVAHEYPVTDSDSIDALNELFESKKDIELIFDRCKAFYERF